MIGQTTEGPTRGPGRARVRVISEALVPSGGVESRRARGHDGDAVVPAPERLAGARAPVPGPVRAGVGRARRSRDLGRRARLERGGSAGGSGGRRGLVDVCGIARCGRAGPGFGLERHAGEPPEPAHPANRAPDSITLGRARVSGRRWVPVGDAPSRDADARRSSRANDASSFNGLPGLRVRGSGAPGRFDEERRELALERGLQTERTGNTIC